LGDLSRSDAHVSG